MTQQPERSKDGKRTLRYMQVSRRNELIKKIATRYKNNILNELGRRKETKNLSLDDKLDIKIDKQQYTRATAVGSNT